MDIKRNPSDPVSEIVQKVAEIKGEEPIALNPTLYDAIDPDALETLFQDGCEYGYVVFEWLGHEIRVDQSGAVSVVSDIPSEKPYEGV